MNFIKKAMSLPVTAHTVSAMLGELKEWEPLVSPVPAPLPLPKDISVGLALEALSANGIMIKNITQNISYSFEGLELELNMIIVVDPKTGNASLNSLNEWFFSKGKGW